MSEKVTETASGQLEISGIDTPLGKAAADYLKAVDTLNNADDAVGKIKEEVRELMKKEGQKTFSYEGRTFTLTKEKVVEEGLRVTNPTKKNKNKEE